MEGGGWGVEGGGSRVKHKMEQNKQERTVTRSTRGMENPSCP